MAASTADGAVGSALSAIQTFYETRCYWSNPEIQLLYYPVVAYWLLALFYDFLGSLRTPWVLKQRVHPPADDKANRMSKGHVIRRVILAHVIQTALGVFMLIVDPPKDNANGSPLKVALQVVMAAFVMDAWQYAIHRCAFMQVNSRTWGQAVGGCFGCAASMEWLAQPVSLMPALHKNACSPTRQRCIPCNYRIPARQQAAHQCMPIQMGSIPSPGIPR